MNADFKKTVLRMIPYGIYILTADDGKGNIAASTVNWVTQTAFAPPLVVVGVKTNFRQLSGRESGTGVRAQHAPRKGTQKSGFYLFQAGGRQ